MCVRIVFCFNSLQVAFGSNQKWKSWRFSVSVCVFVCPYVWMSIRKPKLIIFHFVTKRLLRYLRFQLHYVALLTKFHEISCWIHQSSRLTESDGWIWKLLNRSGCCFVVRAFWGSFSESFHLQLSKLKFSFLSFYLLMFYEIFGAVKKSIQSWKCGWILAFKVIVHHVIIKVQNSIRESHNYFLYPKLIILSSHKIIFFTFSFPPRTASSFKNYFVPRLLLCT